MTAQTNTANLCPRSDLATQVVDDGLLILDRQNDKIHQLNTTARSVWLGLEKGRIPESIASALVEEFDTSIETAVDDVDRILVEFLSLGLLQAND